MKPKKLTLVVMAAGMGRRYGGLKQIEPIGPNGEIALDYAVYDALRAGFGKVVFVVRREHRDLFREQIGKRIEAHVETDYVYQELDNLPQGFAPPAGREKPWGTGHAVLYCADAVGGPFGVVNADDFYGPGSYVALAKYLSGVSEARKPPLQFCMVAFMLQNTLSPHGAVARGVCETDADGFLENIRERTRIRADGDAIVDESDGAAEMLNPRALVSMNMWGFTPAVFSRLRDAFVGFLQEKGSDPKAEFYLPESVGAMVAEGVARVAVLPSAEQWFGMTYRDDRVHVEQRICGLLEAGVYPEKLWND